MIVTFFGHGECYLTKEEKEKVKERILEIIRQEVRGEKVDFLLGGYGYFDSLAKEIVDEYKKENPLAKSILTLPYITPEYLENRKYQIAQYDETAYYDLEEVLPKFAIIARNREMVRRADVVITFVDFHFGGAYTALRYARHLKKKLYNLGSYEI